MSVNNRVDPGIGNRPTVHAAPLNRVDARRAAVSYLERGWAPVPIEHGKKRPPLRLGDWTQLRITPEKVDEYFADSKLGVGIILGEPSNQLVDIDLDCLIAGRIAHRCLPKTRAVFGRPGKPASHWLYVAPGSVTKKFVDPCSPEDDDAKAMIVEIRSTGTQTVFPPTVHVSGEPIDWETDPIEPGIVSPDELLFRVSFVAAAALFARHYPPQGARDEFSFALAGGLVKGGMDEGHAERFIELVATFGGSDDVDAKVRKPAAIVKAQQRGKTVVGFGKLRKIIPPAVVDAAVEWLGLSTKPQAQRDSCTDAANGARFATMHGDEAIYVPEWRKWLVWEDVRWVVDDRNSTRLMAVDTAKAIHDEAKGATAAEEKDLSKWAVTSQQQNRLSAMLWVAQSHLAVASEELDSHRWLFNVQNGTLDLKTDEFREHSRADRLTKVGGVAFDRDAIAPQWEAFLDEVLQGQQPLIDFVRRAAGYTLTGDIGEQCVFFLEGGGANGKTTFIEVVRRILGDYGRPAEFRTLMERRNNDSVRNDLAALRGLRMVSAGEPNRRQKFDEPLLKLLTGGDRITARYLYAEYFDFDPNFKIWLAANHRPRVDGTDDGIWRRIHVIEFHASIPPESRVQNLVEILIRDEGPGILNWMLRGLTEWRRSGLGVPEEVRAATRRYRQENDVLGLFIQECCDVDESRRGTSSRFVVSSAHLREAYCAWCKDEGEQPLGTRELSSLLQERGFANDAKWFEGQQRRCYFGLKLKERDPF